MLACSPMSPFETGQQKFPNSYRVLWITDKVEKRWVNGQNNSCKSTIPSGYEFGVPVSTLLWSYFTSIANSPQSIFHKTHLALDLPRRIIGSHQWNYYSLLCHLLLYFLFRQCWAHNVIVLFVRLTKTDLEKQNSINYISKRSNNEKEYPRYTTW